LAKDNRIDRSNGFSLSFNTMNNTNVDILYQEACKEIAQCIESLDSTTVVSKKEIFQIMRNISSKYKLSKLPKNLDILKLLSEDSRFKKQLKSKPSKTSSGVAVITVMPLPFDCPHGKCIYCPGGIEMNTPLSYIGTEPATKIAQSVNYDPFKQVLTKITQLVERGHDVDKAELVIVGGTFPFYPQTYQKTFVNKCYSAFNKFNLSLKNENASNFEEDNLEKAKKLNETANIRCVGLTIETKPDFCKKDHIDSMLELGATRIEIGVQSLNDSVLKVVNRGHSVNDVYESFYFAKNFGFKIAAHMMPGLPLSSVDQDIDDFKKLFKDERLKPDMLKIYPTLVIKNTGLYKLYQNQKYTSYSTEDLVTILVELKKIVPPWMRIMRIQREIDSKDIIAGPRMGNLRQIVLKQLEKQGISCKCIRCREIGLKNMDKMFSISEIKLNRIDYFSSNSKEIFLSFESPDNSILFGFLRLRITHDPQRFELKNLTKENSSETKIPCGVIRELHVYGPMAKIGTNSVKANNLSKNTLEVKSYQNYINNFFYQHRGLGQKLLEEAERICKEEYWLKKITVISAIGTREYYKKFGYVINGAYVTKSI